MLTAVTGATGHLGGNLVRALLERGRRVRAIVRHPSQTLSGLDVEQVNGDVLEPASLVRAFQGVDVVFHLAAVISIAGDPRGRVSETNVRGAHNVASAARASSVQRMVHCSSIHAFDVAGTKGTVDETSGRADTERHFAYDRSKYNGERAVREQVSRGLDAVIVNPTGAIGPFDFAPSRMGRVLLDLYHRRIPASIQGGFDFVDVRDVVAGMLAAEAKGRTGENYILSGRYHTVDDVAKTASEITGRRAPLVSLPPWMAVPGVPIAGLIGWLRDREPLYTLESLRTLAYGHEISNAKAQRELGYEARSLAQTIRDTYAWFASVDMIPRDAALRDVS
jgi:dihydroflavonol-4-reductase